MKLKSKKRRANGMNILTTDSHKIAVRHLGKSRDEAVILAHGFSTHKDMALFKEMSEMFLGHYDVVTFDFRGHGESGGLFSWTSHEARDLHAVISFAERKGYKKIGLIGFSLGAAATLIEASQNPNSIIKSIIAVSTPYDLWKIDFHFWNPRMLDDMKFNRGPKGKGKFVRPGNPFLPKMKPLHAVQKIETVPILFMHGESDWLIRPHHSEKLFAAAKTPKELRIIPEAGHAEMIFNQSPEKFESICMEWFGKTLS